LWGGGGGGGLGGLVVQQLIAYQHIQRVVGVRGKIVILHGALEGLGSKSSLGLETGE